MEIAEKKNTSYQSERPFISKKKVREMTGLIHFKTERYATLKKYILFMLIIFAIVPFAYPQGLYVGPQLGYQKAKDSDKGNIMGGAALRLKLSEALGVEGSINYRREKFDSDAVSVKTWPVMVTGMFYPVPIIYGAIGAGWYNTTIEYGAALNALGVKNNTEQKFGWHLGAGVELPFSTMVLTGDIRYVFLNYDFKGLPGRDINSDFIMITAGILFRLF
jgi:opacity protein-like surface antigen